MAITEQPNFLVIMADEHAPQASQVYGSPYVKTPNLQRLSESGVVFDQAYCDSPLCTPSRACFMTAQPVHRNGVWDNGVPLASDLPTFAHALVTAGYETVLSGKMHFVGHDQHHGFERRLTEDCHSHEIIAPNWNRSAVAAEDFRRRLLEAGPSEDAAINVFDDKVERESIAYLQEYMRGAQDKPFALVVSFMAPHFPLSPRPEFYKLYEDIVTLPDSVPPYATPEHPVHTRLRKYFQLENLTPEIILRARAAYFGSVTQTDNRIGNILDQLAQLDLSRPTIIIYVSDHGEMMGEHGLWWKTNFFEEAVRVPLIVSSTDHRFPVRREAMPVTLIDVARTIIGLSQADVDHSLFSGVDLTPYLEGRQGDTERAITSEYHGHGTLHSMRMVRKGKYKLNYVIGEPLQLFDLEADPHELVDLSSNPEMFGVIESLLPYATEGWPSDIEDIVRESLRRRRLIVQANKLLPDPFADTWFDLGT